MGAQAGVQTQAEDSESVLNGEGKRKHKAGARVGLALGSCFLWLP